MTDERGYRAKRKAPVRESLRNKKICTGGREVGDGKRGCKNIPSLGKQPERFARASPHSYKTCHLSSLLWRFDRQIVIYS